MIFDVPIPSTPGCRVVHNIIVTRLHDIMTRLDDRLTMGFQSTEHHKTNDTEDKHIHAFQ